KINWLSEDPVWVDQWPLTQKKLQILNKLVDEQLELKHIAPSVSPWNSPVFIIQKSSGKWRLLTDLRQVNTRMESMGSIQPGMPSLTQLPAGWPLVVIDLKDCFFHILLRPEDRPKFAFSVPAVNAEAPNRRFEWCVLPQGMKNSPTLCQMYVSKVLKPLRRQCAEAVILHYMDDIVICAKEQSTVNTALQLALQILSTNNLAVSKEKIQYAEAWKYLGWTVTSSTIIPQQIKLKRDISTLNDLQKLLGTINWIRPIVGITTDELHPLFKLLKGDPQLSSPRKLTPEALNALDLVEKKLTSITPNRKIEGVSPSFVIFLGKMQPFGILDKSVCLWEWIFLPHQFSKTVTTFVEMIGQLIFKGRTRCWELCGQEPQMIYLPLSSERLSQMLTVSTEFQIAIAEFEGQISYHIPQNKVLQAIGDLPVQLKFMQSDKPIPDAKNIFTDGSGRTGNAVVVWQENGSWKQDVHRVEGSPQIVELSAVVRAFFLFKNEPINLISDSAYVIGIVKRIEHSYLKNINNDLLFSLFQMLLFLINHRTHQFFAVHIKAHTTLPGP
ncbi:POK11 protein, partial [Onychorhynchus coronatus]|nr:POK11 protein [Onychorhynchus coronatus]